MVEQLAEAEAEEAELEEESKGLGGMVTAATVHMMVADTRAVVGTEGEEADALVVPMAVNVECTMSRASYGQSLTQSMALMETEQGTGDMCPMIRSPLHQRA